MSTNLEQKLPVFLEIAKALNKHGIIPALYGSLGLYRIIGQIDKIDDIDLIVPDAYLNEDEKFSELIEIMKEIGYRQDKRFPHEFTKGEGQIGFEPESELINFAGADLENLKNTKIDGIEFKELSKEQYLADYKKTLTQWEMKVERIKLKILTIEEDLHK